MLAKNKILEGIRKNEIIISPFNINNLGPISYDMEIGDELQVYYGNRISKVLDTRSINKPDDTINLLFEEHTLEPNNLYLATTKEVVWSEKYIPCVTGRSRFARIGLQVHQTSFFANPGHKFQWVLEITTTLPVKIHRGDKLAQMYFEELTGELKEEDLYNGIYKDRNVQY